MSYPILAAASGWYSQGGTNLSRSTFTKITIIDSYTPTGEETANWNADTNNDGSIKCYVKGTELIISGNGSGKISMNVNSNYIFSSNNSSDCFTNVVTIEGIGVLDSSNVTNIGYAFNNMSSIESIDITNFDTSHVVNMLSMFSNCSSLINIVGLNVLNTSNSRVMANMFLNCSSLEEINLSSFDVSKVTSLSQIFKGCSSATSINVGNWNVSNATGMNNVFDGCESLTTLDVSGWNTSKATNMKGMFRNCKKLVNPQVQDWDVSNVLDMSNMFEGCHKITDALSVNNWNVSKVTNMSRMFSCGNDYGTVYANGLLTIHIDNWNTSSCKNMSYMFYGQRGLQALYLSGWNVEKVENLHHMFAHCRSLVVYGTQNWNLSNATTLNAAFLGVANRTFDVSNWNTINCESFSQVFQNCELLNSITGLEYLNTSKSKSFTEMFLNCSKIEKLDLSNFDTSNADENFIDPINGDSCGMVDMFTGMTKLKEVKIGTKFSFNGSGNSSPALLPTPAMEGSTGKWYSSDCRIFDSSDIPSNTKLTYYAIPSENTGLMFIKYGTLYSIAEAIKEKTGYSSISVSNMADAIRGIQTENSSNI